MSKDLSGSEGATVATANHAGNLSISKWVNERFPPWTELLSAHEVARLTRRPKWALAALTLLGRLPKPERFHGRNVGWHRLDVQRWLDKTRETAVRTTQHSQLPRAASISPTAQMCLMRGRSGYCRRKRSFPSCVAQPARAARKNDP
jgi:predicted DNA-binding transcriptional regulator AlpA